MYLEPSAIRRTAAASAPTSVPAAVFADQFSMTTTVNGLARAFGLVIRQIADLLTMLLDYPALAPPLSRVLDITNSESMHLQQFLEYRLKPVWDWLVNVMDSTEAQLRFGVALSSASTPANASGSAPPALAPHQLNLFGRGAPPARYVSIHYHQSSSFFSFPFVWFDFLL